MPSDITVGKIEFIPAPLDTHSAGVYAEIEALRQDAERWRMIENHWSDVDIKNNRDGSFKSMTITFKAAQGSDELNRDKLRRAFDGAVAQTHNTKVSGLPRKGGTE